MKLKNTMIVTSDDSDVAGFKPTDYSPLGPDVGRDKNGNIVVTGEMLSQRVANKLHDLIDQEFGEHTETEITANEAEFRNWLMDEMLDEDLANRLILSAHDLLFS